jgi:hypothetical protein
MRKVYDNQLDAKVAARNEVNKAANDSFAAAHEALEPFVGQKVCKVSGGLFDKVYKALPPTIEGGGFGLHSWYSTEHGYTLKLNLKTSTSYKSRLGSECAAYAEATVYLGDLSNGVLTKLYDAPNYRTDCTADEIRAARKEVDEAEKAMRAAESKINDFGRYDN